MRETWESWKYGGITQNGAPCNGETAAPGKYEDSKGKRVYNIWNFVIHSKGQIP